MAFSEDFSTSLEEGTLVVADERRLRVTPPSGRWARGGDVSGGGGRSVAQRQRRRRRRRSPRRKGVEGQDRPRRRPRGRRGRAGRRPKP